MRRISRREKLKEDVKSFDVFPKVEPEIQQRTSSGALATILMGLAISALVISEFYYYRTVDVVYKYSVDSEVSNELNMTLDITIAMPCGFLGADYIDVSGQSKDAANWLQQDAAHFELAPNQRQWLDAFAATRELEGAHGLDSLQRFLHGALREPMPEAIPPLSGPQNGCRLHGTMPINRVAANFHITPGKSVHHARGHSHMAGTVPVNLVNFSHRIDRLSFSEEHRGAHTLDGDLKVTNSNFQMYQYFLKVVPTSTQRLDQATPFRSNQFSVTEETRVIEQAFGAGGMPGVYFKFDLEPLTVSIIEQRRSALQFLVRLCAIVGGIFATTGMLLQLLTGVVATAQPPAMLGEARQ